MLVALVEPSLDHHAAHLRFLLRTLGLAIVWPVRVTMSFALFRAVPRRLLNGGRRRLLLLLQDEELRPVDQPRLLLGE